MRRSIFPPDLTNYNSFYERRNYAAMNVSLLPSVSVQSLEYEIEVRGATNPLTALVVDLSGVDPDDAFSTVPYEKGSLFLW